MTSSEDSTIQELHVDEKSQCKLCPDCGSILYADHGIVRMTRGTGVTWWQCPKKDCEKRFKEEYRIELETETKITLGVVEV